VNGYGRHLAFPFRIGRDGRTAMPESLDAHIRGELLQLLLTNTGERPFLPGFGGNVRRLVFEGNDPSKLFQRNDEVAAGLAKASLSQALSDWLGHRISVTALNIASEDARLDIELSYRLIDTGEERRVRFERGGGA
jgi:phage baseplate assembly protein W